MPKMQATRIAAQAVSKLKSAAALLIWMPSEVSEPPKYSPTIAPIIASTLATLATRRGRAARRDAHAPEDLRLPAA